MDPKWSTDYAAHEIDTLLRWEGGKELLREFKLAASRYLEEGDKRFVFELKSIWATHIASFLAFRNSYTNFLENLFSVLVGTQVSMPRITVINGATRVHPLIEDPVFPGLRFVVEAAV